MILNQLFLNNFCIYQGEHVFELTPGQRQRRAAPIVLFGGVNGGGKTTLLDAVQLVLYGKRARCSKRGDKAYDQFLLDCINHDVDPSEGAEIHLSFQYTAEGENHAYEVTRSWSVARENLRERVQVCRDGEVDGWLSENWNQVVEELIPFGVAQLCFFDAEKIRFLAEDETSTKALGEAIKSLLGLDLAERLLTDSAILEARLAKRVTKSDDLLGLEALESELEQVQGRIRKLRQDRAGVVPLQERAANRVREVEEQFAKSGGKHWEQREQRQRRAGELEHIVREAESQLIGLAASDLPLAMVFEQLQSLSRHASEEQLSRDTFTISTLLTRRDAELLSTLEKQNASERAISIVRDFLDTDRRERALDVDLEHWLELPDIAARRLTSLLEDGIPNRIDSTVSLLRMLEDTRRDLENVQRSLAAAPREDVLREVSDSLKAATSELAEYQQRIKRIDKELANHQVEREELQNRVTKLRRKVVDEQIRSEEDVRVASLLSRTQETMREFLNRATASKIDRLSQLVTDSFRYLLRKKSLIERVVIDPNTFSITVIDTVGNVIPKERLSEGEKQIFAISVLWGLSQASARPLPAIIDTPMGRLDANHRTNLVERYFPNASHQVIILSTDTEIERAFFHQLEPHVTRAYHLRYDEKQRVTRAEEGYFWENKDVEQVEVLA